MSNFVKLISGQSNNTIMAGSLTITDTTPAVNTATGALVVAGGAGVAGSLYATNIFLGGVQVPTNATMNTAINAVPTSAAMTTAINSAITSSTLASNVSTLSTTVGGLPNDDYVNNAVSTAGALYPKLLGSNTLTGLLTANGGLTVTGTITVPTNSIPSTAISGLTTAITTAVGATVPTLTGVNTFSNSQQFTGSNKLQFANGVSVAINDINGCIVGYNVYSADGTLDITGGGLSGVHKIKLWDNVTVNNSITLNGGPLNYAYTVLPTLTSSSVGYKLFAQQGSNTTMASTNSIISGITVTIPTGIWLINYSLNVQYQTTSGTGTVYHGVGTSGSPSVYIANNTYCVLGQAVLTGMVVQTITASTVVYVSAYYASATFAAPAVSGSIFATRIA